MDIQPSAIAPHELSANLVTQLAFPARYAHFGAFRADLEREELYQNGQRVKVQAKVFQGLLLLLSRAGEIVTREEVRRQLWPDTFLANLDANVNTTMNKLRQVLGDSPETPVYVETIPRRGYTFIASVEFSSVPGALSAEFAKIALNVTPQAGSTSTIWSKKRVQTFLRVASLLFAGMILGALLAFVWFFAQGRNHRAASDAKVSASVARCEVHPNSA
jgi:DNA-binding winged helix-turn-helix (wHTH) protein